MVKNIFGVNFMSLAYAVGKRVKELLFQKNITQYRLVKLTCLNEKTISDLVNGKTNDVKFSTIYLICQALNVSLEEFVNTPLLKDKSIEI